MCVCWYLPTLGDDSMITTFTETLNDGSRILVRPINRDDMERERAFVDGLSVQSRHDRFLGGVNHLSEKALERLCDVDKKHAMAFIGLETIAGEDVQIGVARFVVDDQSGDAEIAVAVADKWKQSGLDRILLEHLIEYAKSLAIPRLFSLELATNSDLLNLARDLGFTVKADPEDATRTILSLVLTPTTASAAG